MDTFGDDYDISNDEILSLIEESRQEVHESQKDWPAVTDCDRLDSVGGELDRKDILFVQHIDTTPSSCWYCINEIIDTLPNGSKYIGAAFFHFQSTERALAQNRMHINFGTTNEGVFVSPTCTEY